MKGLGESFDAVRKDPGILVSAAKRGDTADVKFLLGHGTDVDDSDEFGSTALMWAAAEGFVEIARLLIDSDADLELKNQWGGTAESCATNRRHPEIITILQEAAESRRRAAEEKIAAEKCHAVAVENQQRLKEIARNNRIKFI
jgi:hypothetical protein